MTPPPLRPDPLPPGDAGGAGPAPRAGGRIGHLVRRFAGSLWPAGPGPADAAWAEGQLLPGEAELWARMSRVDRRHAVGVARRVRAALGEGVGRPVLAAALLHDVGKLASGLGTYGRVVATVSAAVAGREQAEAWSETRGFTRRVGLYLRHEPLGADMLALAGSDPLTVALVREQSAPPEDRTVPPALLATLRAADDA